MDKNFTTNNLIRYAYNETDLSETTIISNKIESSEELQTEYQEICDTIKILNKLILDPSEVCVNNVLHYLHAHNAN